MVARAYQRETARIPPARPLALFWRQFADPRNLVLHGLPWRSRHEPQVLATFTWPNGYIAYVEPRPTFVALLLQCGAWVQRVKAVPPPVDPADPFDLRNHPLEDRPRMARRFLCSIGLRPRFSRLLRHLADYGLQASEMGFFRRIWQPGTGISGGTQDERALRTCSPGAA